MRILPLANRDQVLSELPDYVVDGQQRPHPVAVLELNLNCIGTIDDWLDWIKRVFVGTQNTVVGLLHDLKVAHWVVSVPRRWCRRQVGGVGPHPGKKGAMTPAAFAVARLDKRLDPAQCGVADQCRGILFRTVARAVGPEPLRGVRCALIDPRLVVEHMLAHDEHPVHASGPCFIVASVVGHVVQDLT